MTQSPQNFATPRSLDTLLAMLDIAVRGLVRVPIEGAKIVLRGGEESVICYCQNGNALATLDGTAPISLQRGTLVIGSAGQGATIEAMDASVACEQFDLSKLRHGMPGERVIAGFSLPVLADSGLNPGVVLCGYFRATFAGVVDVFCADAAPMVDQFEVDSATDACFNLIGGELERLEPGAGAMTSALVKQIVISMLRQSRRPDQWARHFLLLKDPQIARAFGEMVTRPGAPHTVISLASLANLSRSAFMARFSDAVGRTPMAVLRDLRMHRAAELLTTAPAMVDHVAQTVGYGSRSGFIRAFRQTFGHDPTELKALS
jgi:AraC family transcriptional activator of mtrCDE